MRWFTKGGSLLVIMLLITSCLRAEGTIVIEDDGSGSVDFLTALNTEAVESIFSEFGVETAEAVESTARCSGFESDFGEPDELPAGAVITPYDQDGFCGNRIEFDLSPSLDQSASLSGVFDPSTRLYKEGNNWFFESDFDSDQITAQADSAPEAVIQALLGEASFRLVVDLPGQAVEGANNATEVDSDGRFVWEVDVLNPPDRLFAQTESGAGGGLNPIVIGVVAALLAAGLALFLVNKRKTDEAAGLPDAGAPNAGAVNAGQQPGIPGASPPTAVGGPMVPASDAAKETIVMNAADIQQAIQDTAAPAPEPVFDTTLNAWVIDDPTRGRLRHDPATDTWNPA